MPNANPWGPEDKGWFEDEAERMDEIRRFWEKMQRLADALRQERAPRVAVCPFCNGMGLTVERNRVVCGTAVMVTQRNTACPACSGKGMVKISEAEQD